MKDETKCLHAGYQPKNAEPRVMPIVQSTTYVYDSTEEVAAVFDDPMKSLIYSRFGNPTVMAVEDKIAELEGGIGAMCTTSGQAAVLLSLLNICNAGDSFISTMEIYGGSVNLFSHTLRRLVDWTNGKFPDLTEPDESYHGISYTETYGKKAYIVKARMQLMRDLAFTLPHIPRFY